MIVRRERPEDVPAVRAVVAAAFDGGDGVIPVEVGLLDRLREDVGWIPRFSLVAEDAGELVGHVVATRGHAGDGPALGIGPVAVRPDRQGRGVGTALLHTLLGAAEAQDEELVVLLGEPAWYGRFGFVPAADLGVDGPDPAWGGYFQARRFTPTAPRGAFRYAAPFDDL
ncbi:N-acetyltransferase [Actinomycetospora lutea]|uniref:GNAT family N-acetyltransferase n=1 Tax=Actinomycetospora lutea TaxID=663604 RepID=UPI002366B3B5|nr:N-acetyltransferase [Actinomycetospora lutea]MDD7940737.1 N-acetyltransferase [Actinomycetospora lutea]